MRAIGNNIESTKDIRLTASGAISSGDKCVINSDGTVSAISATGISQVIGTYQQFSTNTIDKPVVVYSSIDNKIIVVYKDSIVNGLKARVGIINATNHTISFPAAEATLISSTPREISASYDSGSNCCLVAFSDDDDNDAGNIFRLNIKSDNTLHVGEKYNFAGQVSEIAIAYMPTKFHHILAYSADSSSEKGYVRTIRVTQGHNVTQGMTSSAVEFEAGAAKEIAICEVRPPNRGPLIYRSVDDSVLSNSGTGYHEFMVSYADTDSSSYAKARIGYINAGKNNSAITFPTASEQQFHSTASSQHALAYDPINNMVLVAYRQSNGYLHFQLLEPSFDNTGVIGHISGGGGQATIEIDHGNPRPQVVWDETTTTLGESKFIVAYQNQSSSNRGELRHITGKVSTGLASPEPGIVTIGSSIALSGTDVAAFTSRQNGICRDTANDKFVAVYKDGTNGGGSAVVYQPAKTNLLTKYENIGAITSNRGSVASNFIGIATTQAADGDAVTIRTQGKVSNQSNLTEGLLYAVHPDGTLREYIHTLRQASAGLISHSGARVFNQNEQMVTPDGVIAGTAISSTELLVGEI
jgi:predicted RecA/RadA family phage recombinase